MTDYIITEEQLDELEYELSKRLFCMQWQKMQIPEIRSRPLSSALEKAYRNGFNDGQAEGYHEHLSRGGEP